MNINRLMALATLAAITAASPLRAGAPPPTIVSEKDAAQVWKPAPGSARVVAGYPAAISDRAQDVCVNIGFLIHEDGTTSNFVEMKAWHASSGAEDPKAEQVRPFAQSAAAAVSLWRFVPVADKPKHIYTSAAFAFDGSKTRPSGQILDHCRIDDLPGHVADAKREAEKRGSLTRAQLERVRRTNAERRKGIQRVSRSDVE